MLGFDLGSAASLQRFQTQFEDLGKIGTGGFSTVNKVRNKRDQKYYALKTVKIKPSEFKGEIADYLQKILGEARVLSGLKHPNVLQYHGSWVNADLKTYDSQEQEDNSLNSQDEQEQIQLVMEEYSQNSCGFQFEKRSSSLEKKKKVTKTKKQISYKQDPNDNIFGTNLYNYKQIRVYLLSQLGQFSLQKYVNLRNQQYRNTTSEWRKIVIQNYKIILDIIEGLSYIHSQKIIHRDIKLQNIVLDKNKKCKIIDFGLAKRARNLKSLTIQKFEVTNPDECEQRHSSSVGTKIFSSPEQTNSENYDHRTDIYSFAMVIGVLFCQYKTAHEEGEILLNLRNRKLDDFNINEKLKSILYKCLSEQKQRPDLNQIKNCVKKLLKEELRSNTENNGHTQNNLYKFQGNKKLTLKSFQPVLNESQNKVQN